MDPNLGTVLMGPLLVCNDKLCVVQKTNEVTAADISLLQPGGYRMVINSLCSSFVLISSFWNSSSIQFLASDSRLKEDDPCIREHPHIPWQLLSARDDEEG